MEQYGQKSTNLCKCHSVGMFPDFCQTQPLLHFTIPERMEKKKITNLEKVHVQSYLRTD